MRNPFNILALRIIRWKDHLPGNNDKLSRELMELGGGRKNCVESYYVKKIEIFLEIATLCLAVLIAIIVYEHQQDRRVQNGILERPGYGEGAREQNLILTIGPEKNSSAGTSQGASAGTSKGASAGTSQGGSAGTSQSVSADASLDTSSGLLRDGHQAGLDASGTVTSGTDASSTDTSGTNRQIYESESFDVRLDARSYTQSQVHALLESAADKLEKELPGKNKSLDEVRLPLSLPTSFENGAVSAEYYITPGGMIEEDGSICGEPDPEGTLVRISVTLTCQDKTSTYECAACIYPPYLTPEEQFRENIKNAVEQARSSDPSDPKVKLPESVDGRTLRWSYPKDSSLTLIIIFMLILPVAYWAREDSKIHDAAKERQTQLELDYSQILWKLTMLLSAGLTIRGAFTRIADQYAAEHNAQGDDPGEHALKPSTQAGRHTAKPSAQTGPRTAKSSAQAGRHTSEPSAQTGRRTAKPSAQTGRRTAKLSVQAGRHMAKQSQKSPARRYVYEEMILTLREMRSGVPEASAYENFGRRCGLPAYIKLGSLLSQNLKKGSKGLTALLEHEAVLSMDQHKMAVRKLGERASVKMLLPMILMFGVVLIILMVPAFLSM